MLVLGAVGVAVLRSIAGHRDAIPPPPSGWPTLSMGTRVVQYKTTATRNLHLHLFEPADAPSGAVVFFHGGGLVQTPLTQFRRQAENLATLGVLAVIAEYRVAWDGTGFPEALEDAGDAVGYLRLHAGELSLDPTKIAAAGIFRRRVDGCRYRGCAGRRAGECLDSVRPSVGGHHHTAERNPRRQRCADRDLLCRERHGDLTQTGTALLRGYAASVSSYSGKMAIRASSMPRIAMTRSWQRSRTS